MYFHNILVYNIIVNKREVKNMKLRIECNEHLVDLSPLSWKTCQGYEETSDGLHWYVIALPNATAVGQLSEFLRNLKENSKTYECECPSPGEMNVRVLW